MAKESEHTYWLDEAGCRSRPAPCDVQAVGDGKLRHRAYWPNGDGGLNDVTHEWETKTAEHFIDAAEKVHAAHPVTP